MWSDKGRSVSSSKHVRTVFGVVGILALAVVVLVILRITKPEPEQRDVEEIGRLVEVVRAEPRTVRMNITGHGTVQAKTELPLVAQVSGEVVYLAPNLRAGEFIRKDDLLVRIAPKRRSCSTW